MKKSISYIDLIIVIVVIVIFTRGLFMIKSKFSQHITPTPSPNAYVKTTTIEWYDPNVGP